MRFDCRSRSDLRSASGAAAGAALFKLRIQLTRTSRCSHNSLLVRRAASRTSERISQSMRTTLRFVSRLAVAVICAAVVLLASARSASAQLVKSCDPNDAVANTANILCVGSSTCTATAVNFNQNVDISIGANFDFSKAQCPFDLSGKTLTINKTLEMPGGTSFMRFFNTPSITITSTGKLKARGDFVEPNGIIIGGGSITLMSTGPIIVQSGGALIDVIGDAAGTIEMDAGGANASGVGISLGNGTEFRGN